MDFEDLVTEETLGLIHAAELFKPDNGAKFTTYAVIKQLYDIR